MKINLRNPKVLIACLVASILMALAVCVLLNYNGLPKLPPAQLAQYWEVAEQGDYETGGKLAWMYERGLRGLKQDYKEAYYLFSLSYVQAQESDALVVLERVINVKKHLTPQEISEADRRIWEWIKKHPGLVVRPISDLSCCGE